MKTTYTFDVSKETKGAYQFKEVGDEQAMGSIYLKKIVLEEGKKPVRVVVSVEVMYE
jgi:hypothetical protein